MLTYETWALFSPFFCCKLCEAALMHTPVSMLMNRKEACLLVLQGIARRLEQRRIIGLPGPR